MKRLSHAALILAAIGTNAFAEEVSHPVSDYQVSLFRDGGSPDFQGWITLLNGSEEVGFVYIRNGQPARPHLGSTKYVVTDIPVAMLDVTVAMLSSGKPVFITYWDGGNPNNASAFLHVGGLALAGAEQLADMKQRFNVEVPLMAK